MISNTGDLILEPIYSEVVLSRYVGLFMVTEESGQKKLLTPTNKAVEVDISKVSIRDLSRLKDGYFFVKHLDRSREFFSPEGKSICHLDPQTRIMINHNRLDRQVIFTGDYYFNYKTGLKYLSLE